jgi:hypothetical protein
MSGQLEWTDISEENETRKLLVHKGTGLKLDITFFRQAPSRREAGRSYLIGAFTDKLVAATPAAPVEELLVAIAVDGAVTKYADKLPSEDDARQYAEGWERAGQPD